MKRLRVMDVMPEETVELTDSAGFVDAWRQLHHLAQAVVEVGKSWGAFADDDSHSALTFDRGSFAFESASAEGDVVATLRMAEGSVGVVVMDENGDVDEMTLLDADGLTLERVTRRVRELAEAVAGGERQASKPAPDLPEHRVAKGEPFDLSDADDLGAVFEHYALTQFVLERLFDAVGEEAKGDHELTPRLWPHHFDLASLFVAERDGDGGIAKTIGVGLTPPDDVEGAGYWYVSPWTKRDPSGPFAKADLPIGRWEDRGKVAMAVLPLSEVWELAESSGVEDAGPIQAAAVAEFVAVAFNGCAEGLGV